MNTFVLVQVLVGLTAFLLATVSAQGGPEMPIDPCDLLGFYRAMDKNNDKKVTKKEFNDYFGFDDDELFSLVDANGDGVLLYEQLEEECD